MSEGKRILAVGEQPPTAAAIGGEPLRGQSGDRLASFAGVAPADFFSAIDAVNLIEEIAAPRWPVSDAKERAKIILEFAREEGYAIVTLGSRVAAAFDFDPPSPATHEWFEESGGASVACAAHPSGRSGWWRLSKNLVGAQRFWHHTYLAACKAKGLTRDHAKPHRARDPVVRKESGSRPPAELDWIRDRLEVAYVELGGSASSSAKRVCAEHRVVCDAGEELDWEGLYFTPSEPLSRRQADLLLNDVRDRWRALATTRIEDRREGFLEVARGLLADARAGGEWMTAARILHTVGELEGLLGRPDERQASVSIFAAPGSQVAVGELEKLSDQELEQRAKRLLSGERVVVDAEAAVIEEAQPEADGAAETAA